jgi:sec-independent protein translocase protein TatA
MGLDNPIHLAFLLILALLVFGAKRLPEMGRSLGSGMRGFRDALGGDQHPVAPEAEARVSVAEVPAPQSAPQPAPAAALQPISAAGSCRDQLSA